MLVNFVLKIISLCHIFFLPAAMFYLLNYKIWDMLQDQNQGRPRGMTMSMSMSIVRCLTWLK